MDEKSQIVLVGLTFAVIAVLLVILMTSE